MQVDVRLLRNGMEQDGDIEDNRWVNMIKAPYRHVGKCHDTINCFAQLIQTN